MNSESRSDDFNKVVEEVRKKEGHQLLNDDDLIKSESCFFGAHARC